MRGSVPLSSEMPYQEQLESKIESLRQQLAANALHGMNREAWVIQLEEKLASRDAEVAELKQDAADFRGQSNRLTEWNNNLVSHRDELLAERDELRKQVTLLRDAVREAGTADDCGWCQGGEYITEVLDKALAATEPKEGK